jgi:hypothetical protein
LLTPGVGTPVTATVAGTPVGPVQLLWRATASQAFTAIDMTSTGNGNYSATLPAFGCSETPQFYYAFTEQSCGPVSFPSGAPANFLSADVGTLQTVFQDNFQTNLGWTPSNLGATSGDWQRGVPGQRSGLGLRSRERRRRQRLVLVDAKRGRQHRRRRRRGAIALAAARSVRRRSAGRVPVLSAPHRRRRK